MLFNVVIRVIHHFYQNYSTYRRCHEKTSYVWNFAWSFYCMNGSIEGRCTNYKNSSVCNSDFIARSVILIFQRDVFALYRHIYALQWKMHNLTHTFFRDNNDIHCCHSTRVSSMLLYMCINVIQHVYWCYSMCALMLFNLYTDVIQRIHWCYSVYWFIIQHEQ